MVEGDDRQAIGGGHPIHDLLGGLLDNFERFSPHGTAAIENQTQIQGNIAIDTARNCRNRHG